MATINEIYRNMRKEMSYQIDTFDYACLSPTNFKLIQYYDFNKLVEKFNFKHDTLTKDGSIIYRYINVPRGEIRESECIETLQICTLGDILEDYIDFENILDDYELGLLKNYLDIEWVGEY